MIVFKSGLLTMGYIGMIFIPGMNRIKLFQGNCRNMVGMAIDPDDAHRMLRSDNNHRIKPSCM